jgi:Tfp pilus assembly protein PilF
MGCVVRLGLVLFLLLLLAIAAIWMVAGGAVSAWVVDVGQSTGVMAGVPTQTERGIAAYHRGDTALAARELDQAARTYRRSALALLYLARIEMDAGDPVRAGEYLDEAITREPANAIARRMLGEYHLTRARGLLASGADTVQATSELMGADSNLAQAVSLDPSDRRSRGYYGCVLSMLGRMDEARDALAAAGSGPWDDCVRIASP